MHVLKLARLPRKQRNSSQMKSLHHDPKNAPSRLSAKATRNDHCDNLCSPVYRIICKYHSLSGEDQSGELNTVCVQEGHSKRDEGSSFKKCTFQTFSESQYKRSLYLYSYYLQTLYFQRMVSPARISQRNSIRYGCMRATADETREEAISKNGQGVPHRTEQAYKIAV